MFFLEADSNLNNKKGSTLTPHSVFWIVDKFYGRDAEVAIENKQFNPSKHQSSQLIVSNSFEDKDLKGIQTGPSRDKFD